MITDHARCFHAESMKKRDLFVGGITCRHFHVAEPILFKALANWLKIDILYRNGRKRECIWIL